jgi:hypothetical protein
MHQRLRVANRWGLLLWTGRVRRVDVSLIRHKLTEVATPQHLAELRHGNRNIGVETLKRLLLRE